MTSPNAPNTNCRKRVLEAALDEVHRRRTHRRAVVAGSISVVLVAFSIVWKPKPEAQTLVVLEKPKPSLIEHIEVPRPFQFVQQATGKSQIQYITEVQDLQDRIQILSDDQLLASLPPDRPAALVVTPDGTPQLVFLR